MTHNFTRQQNIPYKTHDDISALIFSNDQPPILTFSPEFLKMASERSTVVSRSTRSSSQRLRDEATRRRRRELRRLFIQEQTRKATNRHSPPIVEGARIRVPENRSRRQPKDHHRYPEFPFTCLVHRRPQPLLISTSPRYAGHSIRTSLRFFSSPRARRLVRAADQRGIQGQRGRGPLRP